MVVQIWCRSEWDDPQPEIVRCTGYCCCLVRVAVFSSEVVLKILADDRYCGRVIGKEGRVIKKIREDTNTRIIVSRSQTLANSH